MTHPLSVAVAGLGTVGGGVLKLLRDNADLIAARAGRPIAVTAVSARDRTRDRGVPLTGLRWYEDPVALASDPAVDVIVELIGGSDGPARALAEAAIAAGKPLVTANKARRRCTVPRWLRRRRLATCRSGSRRRSPAAFR
jgi:homoserine dehydrogenase